MSTNGAEEVDEESKLKVKRRDVKPKPMPATKPKSKPKAKAKPKRKMYTEEQIEAIKESARNEGKAQIQAPDPVLPPPPPDTSQFQVSFQEMTVKVSQLDFLQQFNCWRFLETFKKTLENEHKIHPEHVRDFASAVLLEVGQYEDAQAKLKHQLTEEREQRAKETILMDQRAKEKADVAVEEYKTRVADEAKVLEIEKQTTLLHEEAALTTAVSLLVRLKPTDEVQTAVVDFCKDWLKHLPPAEIASEVAKLAQTVQSLKEKQTQFVYCEENNPARPDIVVVKWPYTVHTSQGIDRLRERLKVFNKQTQMAKDFSLSRMDKVRRESVHISIDEVSQAVRTKFAIHKHCPTEEKTTGQARPIREVPLKKSEEGVAEFISILLESDDDTLFELLYNGGFARE